MAEDNDLATAVAPYEAEADNEIDLHEGELVRLVESAPADEWWLGRRALPPLVHTGAGDSSAGSATEAPLLTGSARQGYFPAAFVRVLGKDEVEGALAAAYKARDEVEEKHAAERRSRGAAAAAKRREDEAATLKAAADAERAREEASAAAAAAAAAGTPLGGDQATPSAAALAFAQPVSPRSDDDSDGSSSEDRYRDPASPSASQGRKPGGMSPALKRLNAAARKVASMRAVTSTAQQMVEARSRMLGALATSASDTATVIVEATHDYEAEADNEMSLKRGDIVHVDSRLGEWWSGKVANTGREGFFPASFVEVVHVAESDASGGSSVAGSDDFGDEDDVDADTPEGRALAHDARRAELNAAAAETASANKGARARLLSQAALAGTDGDDDGDTDRAPPGSEVPPSRARVIKEILTTEVAYVEQLETLNDVYLWSLRKGDTPWKTAFLGEPSVAVLMSSLSQILEVNRVFLSQVREHVISTPGGEAVAAAATAAAMATPSAADADAGGEHGEWDNAAPSVDFTAFLASGEGDGGGDEVAAKAEADATPTTAAAADGAATTSPSGSNAAGDGGASDLPDPSLSLGEFFTEFAPHFSLYGQYAMAHDDAAAHVDRLASEEAARAELDTLRMDPRCGGRDMRAFLIAPIQRVPRYRLLLQELLKRTPRDHADRRPLREAIKGVDEAAKSINSAIRRREMRATLKGIAAKFIGDIDLVVTGRDLILEGPLIKVCRRANKEFYFHLFNDMLLYSEATVLGYRLHRTMELHLCAVEDVEEDAAFEGTPPNGFNVLSTSKSFMVCAPTPGDKSLWMTELQTAIVAARAAAHQRADATLAQVAPVWIPDRAARRCRVCRELFTTVSRRRHHCRMCGAIVCNACSKARRLLRNIDAEKPVRVCSDCVNGSSHGSQTRFSLSIEVRGARQLPVPEGKAAKARAGSVSGALGAAGGGSAEAASVGAAAAAAASLHPFVRAFCEQQLCGQTAVARATRNPTWPTSSFAVSVRDVATAELRLEVFSYDKWLPNALLGHVKIPVVDFMRLEQQRRVTRERFYPLVGQASAGVTVAVTVLAPPSLEAADDPMSVIRAWEARMDDNPCEAHARAPMLMYSAAIALCNRADASPARKAQLPSLQAQRARFIDRPDVVALGLLEGAGAAAAASAAAGVRPPSVSLGVSPVRGARAMTSDSVASDGSVDGSRDSPVLATPTRSPSVSAGTAGEASVHGHDAGSIGESPPSASPSAGGGGSIDGDAAATRRRHVAQLIAAERRYVAELDVLVTCYVNPLSDVAAGASATARRKSMALSLTAGSSPHGGRRSLMNFGRRGAGVDKTVEATVRDAGVAVLLSAAPQLKTLNAKLLADLESHLATAIAAAESNTSGGGGDGDGDASDSDVHVGDILLEFTRLLRLYDQYAVSYASAIHTLSAPSLAPFLDDLAANPATHGRQMHALLKLPLTRLRAFHASLCALAEAGVTPAGHPDTAHLRAAVRLTSAAVEEVAETMRRREQLDRLTAMAEALVDWPADRFGPLVGAAAAAAFGLVSSGAGDIDEGVGGGGGGPGEKTFVREGPLTLLLADGAEVALRAWLLADALVLGIELRPGSFSLFERVPLVDAALEDADTTAVTVARICEAVLGVATHPLAPVKLHEPKWCGLCKQFIWGLRTSALKCGTCGLTIHKACAPAACVVPCVDPEGAAAAEARDKATASASRNTRLGFALLLPPLEAATGGDVAGAHAGDGGGGGTAATQSHAAALRSMRSTTEAHGRRWLGLIPQNDTEREAWLDALADSLDAANAAHALARAKALEGLRSSAASGRRRSSVSMSAEALVAAEAAARAGSPVTM